MIKCFNMARRQSLKSLGMLGAAGVITSSRPDSALAALPKEHATALAIVGDRYHNPDYIRTSLNKTLVRDNGLTIDYLWNDEYFTEDLLSNYKMLIMFRDGMLHSGGYMFAYPDDLPSPGRDGTGILSTPPLTESLRSPSNPWMTREQGMFIKRWVNNGGSLWSFHNNSHCGSMNEDYRKVQGAAYAGHPRIRPYWVRIKNHDHPVTSGIEDFQVVDEQHYMTYDKDPKNILAESSYEGDDPVWTDNNGGKSTTAPAVWAYDYGKGRVCFMSPGHMVSVMWNPMYEKMQKNGLIWLLETV
ncbi:ThuA domain-containing protein [Candidatus Latescibacterota bacterium]